MKSEMIEAGEDKELYVYPALYVRDTNNEPVVVFVDILGNATVVYSENEGYDIGELFSDWKFYDFKLFNGEVKMSNN